MAFKFQNPKTGALRYQNRKKNINSIQFLRIMMVFVPDDLGLSCARKTSRYWYKDISYVDGLRTIFEIIDFFFKTRDFIKK